MSARSASKEDTGSQPSTLLYECKVEKAVGEAGTGSPFQVELLSWKKAQQAWIIELS
jgi:hypothetical protein